jgi:predicted GIY-YIG superfamily endonuclease
VSRQLNWFVYILRCADNTFYTGITKDIERRIAMHERGSGAKYTKGRGPYELVYQESHPTMGQALKREAAIKALSRAAKLKLIGVVV